MSVYKGVTLEDGVFCGPSMVFTNIYNPRAEISKMDQVRPTLVKKGATIGANATIVCGVTIGTYAFIGAGAVVTKDVPDHALCRWKPGAGRSAGPASAASDCRSGWHAKPAGKNTSKEKPALPRPKAPVKPVRKERNNHHVSRQIAGGGRALLQ